ncbi:MAG: MFS transporter [Alphaproteobacteria bacterium]|nr:MFS transporter [Alphaproteobacteria bacterium]MBV8411365.1 MFS transporter [Alphaproteobacteria bacterium]
MPSGITEPPPLAFLESRSFHPWLVVTVASSSAFIGQLDASIVQLALPALKITFGASIDDVRWVAIAYLLAFAATLPLFGRMCELYGRKLLYLSGFAIFSLASLLCGSTNDLGWLIALRAVQGVGGGLLGANSIAILVKSVPLDKRATGIALLTATQAIGVGIGPIVGGVLLEALSWRWIFWVTVPFGLAAALLGWLVLPRSNETANDMSLDWYGALLLMPALVLAVLALNQISVWSPDSLSMLLCVAGAAGLFVLFARRERVARWPLIDLTLFARVAFTTGLIRVALGYALLYGMLFLMSFALVHGLHNSPAVAGLKLALIPIALGVIAPLGVVFSDRFTPRRVGVVSMILCTAAIAALSAIAFAPRGALITGLSAFAIFGMGLGLYLAPNSTSTIGAAPASQSGAAGALVNLFRTLGSCVGISAASSMMSWRMHQAAGADFDRILFEGSPLLDAIESSLLVLAGFALMVIVTAWINARFGHEAA